MSLTNAASLRALLARGGLLILKEGLVSSYDGTKAAVKVKLQPNDQETGWLPILVPMIGDQWGVAFGPAQGDQAIVAFAEGDAESGICLGFIYSDADQPLGVPSGEMWLKHKSGAFIKLTNDPKIDLDTGAGASVVLSGSNITSAGTWAHTGDLTASGTITGTTEVKGGSAAIKLSTHKHTGVQAGSGTSAGPTN